MSTETGTSDTRVESFTSSATTRYRIGLVLAVLQLVVAALVWSINIWTAATAVFVGVSQFVIIGLIDLRIGGRSRQSAGNVVVQHSWFVLSTGIAGAAIFSSPFFSVPTSYVAASIVINLGWAVIGAYMIYWSVTVADARATI